MSAAFEQVFRFLFKHPPLAFERGSVGVEAPLWLLVGGGLLLLVLAPRLLGYSALGGRAGRRDRLLLAAVRGLALALLLLALCHPYLALPMVVPQQSFVGVLIDDSRSLAIGDGPEGPRSAFVARELGAEGALLAGLQQRFKVRLFGFAADARRATSAAELRFDGTRSDVGKALGQAHAALAGLPLAALVLVSDGADQGDSVDDALAALRAARVPVFTVGLGRERFARDAELVAVEAPRRVLKGAAFEARVLVRQRGLGGEHLSLVAEDEGRVVRREPLERLLDGETTPVRLTLRADEAGPRRFRFALAVQPGETLAQNNVREVLVDVRGGPRRILYVEGEPRYELKFVRRAVADDDVLQVVALQRSAKNRFLRLGVASADELAAGFPRTREELYRFDGVVLGSVEAGFFTPDQQRMLAEYVGERGGGLLMLGGRASFAEGGWRGTPLAEVLPVALGERTPHGDFFAEARLELTAAGRGQALLQLADDEAASAARFAALPPLTLRNRLGPARPGATTLLVAHAAELSEPQVALAWQRYGRGRSLAFAVQDSWQWQMHATVAVEDRSHERLWGQLLRFLVDGTPGTVRASAPREAVAPGETLQLVAEVEDARALPVNDASVSASLAGSEERRRLDWVAGGGGRYAAGLRLETPGVERVRVEARQGESLLGEDELPVLVADPVAEAFGAERRTPLLERIADETGGRFYEPAEVKSLIEDLHYAAGGATRIERHPLWDAPALLIAVLLLLAGEWLLRRRRRLA
jgi:uncharacterized membrane protein